MGEVIIRCGDAREELRKLPANWVHTVVTSPPLLASTNFIKFSAT